MLTTTVTLSSWGRSAMHRRTAFEIAASGLGSTDDATGACRVAPAALRASGRTSPVCPAGVDGAGDALAAGRRDATATFAATGGWDSGARTADGSCVWVSVPAASAAMNSRWAGAFTSVPRSAPVRGAAPTETTPSFEIDHDPPAFTRDAQVRPVHGDPRALDVHGEGLAGGYGDDLSLDRSLLEREDERALHVRHGRSRSRVERQRHLSGPLHGRPRSPCLQHVAQGQSGSARHGLSVDEDGPLPFDRDNAPGALDGGRAIRSGGLARSPREQRDDRGGRSEPDTREHQPASARRREAGPLAAPLALDPREELRVDRGPIDALRRVRPQIGASLREQLVEAVAHASPSPAVTLEKRTSRPASDGSSRSIASISRRA